VGRDIKICSLLPSATEILYSLGLGDQVVAVTHECDYPPAAAAKTKITDNAIDHERLTSAEIDHHVTSNVGRHGSIYRLKEELLETLRPDLIVTQELCDVCAVSYKEVQRAARVLEGQTRIVSLEPNTLEEVFQTIMLVGEYTGRQQSARETVQELQARLDRVRRRVTGLQPPRVYAMEWLDPPFSAGHWVPEMVEIAGGHEVLGKAGAKSERITPEAILQAAPEIIVLMPCGFSLERTIEEYRRTSFLPGWTGPVYAVDGSSYFNRPGPRLIDGVEILAEIFHPREAQARKRAAIRDDRGSDESNRNFKRLS
jgi:iron complex transport system substrate-binding protein